MQAWNTDSDICHYSSEAKCDKVIIALEDYRDFNTANRLTGASQSGLTSSCAYSGRGDRLQQTVNGATAPYTLDLADPAGLTQVLSDYTNKHGDKPR